VLVIDHDADALEEIGHYLMVTGRQPLLAQDSRKALAWLRENHKAIHTAIVNYNMPDMNGDRLLQELRRAQPEIRVVLCMKTSRRDILRRAPESNVAAYLNQPFSMAQLGDAVDRAVRARGVVPFPA
jgi:DNA-binding NtrC family response regulator